MRLACAAYHQGAPAQEPDGTGGRKQEPQREMPSLDPEHSNEEVCSSNFGHTSGDNFGDNFCNAYKYNGKRCTEEGSTGDQEAVGELCARPS